MESNLRIATCQFPVGDSIVSNARFIKRHIKKASDNAADIIHFPECALSGYGSQLLPLLDWKALESQVKDIQSLARMRKIWVLLGSYHRGPEDSTPFNSVYLISY